MATCESLPVFREPFCLIENCSDGTLKICSDVLNQLSKISVPMNVVCIAGPYRTGKSYLLNRLAGTRKGFQLGSTTEATTKGIWAWCRPHPTRPNEVILLLDTEGLGDIAKDNEENDNLIFALSVLLSSTLVYNTMFDRGQDELTKLHYLTELTQRIKTRATSSNQNGEDLYRFFPNLVWVMRDCYHRLERKDQPNTSDEYLAPLLKLKEGTGIAIDDYNRPRRCITQFFKTRKCFAFPIPVEEMHKMTEMERLPESELNVKFLDEAEKLSSYIYSKKFPKTARGQPIYGKTFCNLLENYVRAIQRSEVPYGEDAVKNMVEKENANPDKMNERLMSISNEQEFSEAHEECSRMTVERSMSLSKLDEKQKYQSELKGRASNHLKKFEPAGDTDTQKEGLDLHQEIEKNERGVKRKKELEGKTEDKSSHAKFPSLFMSAEPAGKEVLESVQVNDKEHERGSEVKKELKEKTDDPDWIMEIHDIFLDGFCKEKLGVFLSVRRTDSVLTNLLQVIIAKNNKEALCIMMVYISKKWKEDFGDNTISVWLGNDHREEKTGEMVLVCFHSAVAFSKFSQYFGLPIIYRRLDETEMEPLENRLQEKYRTVPFKKIDADNIKRLIDEHGENLFKSHSNLEAITASSVKSTKKGIEKKTSIILYCRLKGVIPFGEEFFPKQLKVDDQEYLTDIREGFFSLGMNPAQRLPSTPHPHFVNNPLRMGCSIGSSGSPFYGTLGPFVRISPNEIGFLTCAHVLGINSSKNKTQVVQPADNESGLPDVTRLCGTFVRENFDPWAIIGVDAALVCIDQTKRHVDLGGFVWMGLDQPRKLGMFEVNSPSFEDGLVIGNPDLQNLGGRRDVFKFGRTTGLTQGLLVLENTMLKVHSATLALPDGMPLPHGYPNNTFIMKGQFLIQNVGNEPFFSPGDSGAGVYTVKRNHSGEHKLALIGIAIGSITSGECAMTPIGRVLGALGLKESDVITEGSMETNLYPT